MKCPLEAEPVLRLWRFTDAPLDLRRLAPACYPGGWIALIVPPSDQELLDLLLKGASAPGDPVLAVRVEAFGTIVVGPAIAGPPSCSDAGLDA